MAKKKSNIPAPTPVSWRDIPREIPDHVATPAGRVRQLKGFFKIYAVVCGAVLCVLLVLAAPRLSREFQAALAARIPDSPVNHVEIHSNGPLNRNIGWFNSHVGLPANSTLQRFDHVALRNVLLGFGQIESAVVEKKVPDRLVITLTERTPFARLAVNGPDGLPSIRMCATDGILYEGYDYAPSFFSSLPWVTLRSLQRDGQGGFKPAPEITLALELLTVARRQFPELAASFKTVDLTHYYGDRNDPASWVTVNSTMVTRILIPSNGFDKSLNRLRSDLARLRRDVGPLAEVDLRRLPGSPFQSEYTIVPVPPPAPPAVPAKTSRATASLRRL